jgi:hypothetical protein
MKKISTAIILALLSFSCGKDDAPSTAKVTTADVKVTIDENPKTGQDVATVSASTDQGSLNFKLTQENPSGALALDASSGKITVKNADLFDFESQPQISATVVVSSGATSKNAMVTISLNDIKIPQNGLVAHYPLDGDPTDMSVNANTGTAMELALAEDRNGIADKAFDFSKPGAFIDLDDQDFFHGADKNFAISFWMKPTASLDNSTILSKLSQSTSCGEDEQEFIMRVRNGKLSIIFYGNSASSYRGFLTDTDLQLDQWYHVVVNYKADPGTNEWTDRFEVVINQTEQILTLDTSVNAFPFDIEDTDSHLAIGNRLDSNGDVCVDVPFQGTLDEMAIYDRNLTETEITSLWEDKF